MLGDERLGLRSDFAAARMQCRAHIVSGFHGAVHEADLVLVQQMREHVAGGHGIRRPAELPAGRVGDFLQARILLMIVFQMW